MSVKIISSTTRMPWTYLQSPRDTMTDQVPFRVTGITASACPRSYCTYCMVSTSSVSNIEEPDQNTNCGFVVGDIDFQPACTFDLSS